MFTICLQSLYKITVMEVFSGCLWIAAAAAAKSLQSCLTLRDPIDSSPPGSPVPGILQARTLEWVAIAFSNAWMWKVKVKSLSRVWLFATPWSATHQAPPSMGFSRQEYWSGVPSPSLMLKANSFKFFLFSFMIKTCFLRTFTHSRTSLVVRWLGIRLPVQEMQVWPLGQEDLLEKEMSPHSSVLAW